MTHDSTHQGGNIPPQVHEVHGSARNSARVRLRLWFVVPIGSNGEERHCGPAAGTCALKHVRYFGVRERDIEKIVLSPCGHWSNPRVLATFIIKNAADRIEDNNGSTSK